MVRYNESIIEFNQKIDKIIKSENSLDKSLSNFNVAITELLARIIEIGYFKFHNVDTEVNPFQRNDITYAHCRSYSYSKGKIIVDSTSIWIDSNIVYSRYKSDKLKFVDGKIRGISGKNLFPIYTTFSKQFDIIHYLIELNTLGKVHIEDLVFLSQIIDLNARKIFNIIRNRIINEIEYANIELSSKSSTITLNDELHAISQILKKQLKYDECLFLLKDEEPDKSYLKYYGYQDNLSIKYSISESSSLLAVKSYSSGKDIKLIYDETIKSNTDIEHLNTLSRKIFSNVDHNILTRWVSIGLKGRSEKIIGLIKLFNVKKEINKTKSHDTFKFILVKSIQRTIYHIIQDYYIFEKDKNSRNKIIANLMHQIISPLMALAWRSRDLASRVKHVDSRFQKSVFYLKQNAYECSDKARSFQSLIDFEYGNLKSNLTRVADVRLEVMKKVIDYQPKAMSDRNVTIHVLNEGPEKVSATINKKIFSHIISNLLDNAIKYSFESHDRQELGYNAHPENDEDRENIQVNIYQLGDTIIEIRNIGAPVAVFEEELIFDREYRGHNSEDYTTVGNGIGLYIVREFTHILNGKVSYIRSSDPNCTTIRLSLLP